MSSVCRSQKTRGMVMLFTLTYMVSYITRINYGAIVAELESISGMSRNQLSLALTGSFITYGIGQVVSGIWGDHASPKKLVSAGLVTTAAMNLLLPFCVAAWQMTLVWGINGFAQAFLWPPIVRLMTNLFDEVEYSKAAVRVSCGSSVGTVVVYLLSPPVIALFRWKAVFWFSAVAAGLMAVVWAGCAPDVPPVKRACAGEEKSVRGGGLFQPLMAGIMGAIMLQGALRDGVTTWMPSYISETYQLSSLVSILTGVTLPVFGIVCFQAASVLYRKLFCRPPLSAGVLFTAGAFLALFLYFFSGQNAAVSVFLSALLTGCMHGVNLILICMVPPFFKEQGNVSTVSGVLNACTYIGSAISAYGIAGLSEGLGWRFTLLSWCLIAAAGAVLSFCCISPWKKLFHTETASR